MRGIITVFPAGPDPSDASQAVCASRWQVQGTRLFPTEWCVWECEPPAGDLLHLSGSTSPFPANSNHSTTSSNAVSALPASRYSNSWCCRGRHGIWWNSSVAAVCLRSAEVCLIDSDIALVIWTWGVPALETPATGKSTTDVIWEQKNSLPANNRQSSTYTFIFIFLFYQSPLRWSVVFSL